jgi:hypothetical protein
LIDLEEAKALPLVRMWLQAFGERWNTPARIVEGEVLEYDWGWQIPCAPADPPAGGWPPKKYLMVDRVTGHVRLVGNGGPNVALSRLLARRQDSENE